MTKTPNDTTNKLLATLAEAGPVERMHVAAVELSRLGDHRFAAEIAPMICKALNGDPVKLSRALLADGQWAAAWALLPSASRLKLVRAWLDHYARELGHIHGYTEYLRTVEGYGKEAATRKAKILRDLPRFGEEVAAKLGIEPAQLLQSKPPKKQKDTARVQDFILSAPGPVTANQIAEAVGISPANATTFARRLAKRVTSPILVASEDPVRTWKAERVACACGCGESIIAIDKAGRRRDYIVGHNPKRTAAK